MPPRFLHSPFSILNSAPRLLPYVLAATLLAVGYSQLGWYGVTWDEALGDLFFGERYLSFFTTFDSRYLDFESDPYPPDHVPDLRSSEFRTRPWEYWPVANVLAAATSRMGTALGAVDPFDGFHLVNLLLGACFLVAFYRFVEKWSGNPARNSRPPLGAGASRPLPSGVPRDGESPVVEYGRAGRPTAAGETPAPPMPAPESLGTGRALVATLVLFLMPRVVADLMANIKDFPEMVFFSAALIAFFGAYERASVRGLLGAGLVWGLALGTKANAWFLPGIVFAFVLMRGLEPWHERKRALAAGLAGAGLAGVGVMVATWPYLWEEPLVRLIFNFNYLFYRVSNPRAGTTIDPWFAIATTTPPLVLLVAAIGVVVLARAAIRRDPFAAFVLAWFGVVALRISTGGTNFDGVRHFLEIFPAVAILAAVGSAAVAASLAARAGRLEPAIRAVILTIPIAASAFATSRSHPFESAYWNAFVGGLKGAQQRNVPQSTDYWAASYRIGMRWLNEHAPRGAILMVPIAGHTVKLAAPLRLRADIRYVVYPRGGDDAAARRRLAETRSVAARIPLYVMFVTRRDWSTELDRDCALRLEPEATWTVDGAPVLLIYRYGP